MWQCADRYLVANWRCTHSKSDKRHESTYTINVQTRSHTASPQVTRFSLLKQSLEVEKKKKNHVPLRCDTQSALSFSLYQLMVVIQKEFRGRRWWNPPGSVRDSGGCCDPRHVGVWFCDIFAGLAQQMQCGKGGDVSHGQRVDKSDDWNGI